MKTNNSLNNEQDDDARKLAAAGYKQSMPRQFSLWSLAALAFDLTCTWLGVGSSIGIGLTEASGAGVLWSIIVAGCMTMIVAAGMAELASAYPVAGAQYYWSFMVASDKYKPFTSFLNGWVSILGWWLGAASVANFIASMIFEIILAWYPGFKSYHWQQYLIYVALTWLAVAFNIFASRWIPLFNKLIFVLAVITLSATMLTLFIVSRNKHASASFIFTDTTSRTGWSSDGFAFLLAISNSVYSFLGSDCGAHLCEEIPNPAKNVPKVILYPLVVGMLTAFPFGASLLYSITDLKAVFNTPTGLPLIEIYYQGTRSKSAASVLLAMFAFCFFANMIANMTTSSRTLWAVSRDDTLPYSSFWMQVSDRFEMPLNAMLLSGTVITIYGVIFIGSTTAFSAMVSAAVIFQQTSCVLPQAVLLYRGREKILPQRYFKLGKLGPVVNAVAVSWVLFLDVLYCFPTTRPVTPQNMSYVSVVSTGLVIFIIGLWFTTKRQVFKGPKIDFQLMNQRRIDAIEREVSATALDFGENIEPKVQNEH
ncbi:hypothetical protein N7510_002733 [Penicillium lagena]|uniref:uncharacterized protein n=1 Tax=Penicillium lagena TaxID=94218 RepID=UPI0025416000|nr:uncharacterized protein N7510_002733 [Penicillium lagena]KAJ5618749.1 hypothetical protein N7510_002733 [Penicillium lagena]